MSGFLRAALLGTTFLAASMGVASAGGLSLTGGTPGVFTAETGQSVPTGTSGSLGPATLSTLWMGNLTFTYGPPPPAGLAGGTGHGNSTQVDEFWVGTNEASARAAGDFFCTIAGGTCAAASAVGDSFTLHNVAAGPVQFGFLYDQSPGHTLVNGTSDAANGGYLIALFDAGQNAFIGLSDLPLAGDHDYQDLTVLVDAPEPASATILALGLAGLWMRRRGSHRTARL